MSEPNLRQSVEALIFASGDPVPKAKICDILACSPEQAEEAVNQLNAMYQERESALSIVALEDCWQMTSLPQFAPIIRKMLEILRNTPLSSAAFEVLAVVAYNQPVTKSFIEQVRGVDCSGVVSSLVEKGLIEEKGRLELPGRPLIYGTTKQFLRCFELNSLEDLPPLPKKENAAENPSEEPSENLEEGVSNE